MANGTPGASGAVTVEWSGSDNRATLRAGVRLKPTTLPDSSMPAEPDEHDARTTVAVTNTTADATTRRRRRSLRRSLTSTLCPTRG